MTTLPAPVAQDVNEAIRIIRELLGDAPCDEVTVEVTRGGTMKLHAKRGAAAAKHDWKARK